jgi:hypothetical protein
MIWNAPLSDCGANATVPQCGLALAPAVAGSMAADAAIAVSPARVRFTVLLRSLVDPEPPEIRPDPLLTRGKLRTARPKTWFSSSPQAYPAQPGKTPVHEKSYAAGRGRISAEGWIDRLLGQL